MENSSSRHPPTGEGGYDDHQSPGRKRTPNPFDDHILDAYRQTNREVDDERLQYWQRTFFLARRVMAHPYARAIKPAALAYRVLHVLREAEEDVYEYWHTDEIFTADFVDACGRVLVPDGQDPVDEAVRLAHQKPLRASLPPGAAEKRSSGYPRFLSAVGWLARLLRRDVVALPCRKLALALGVEPMTISRYRQWAVKDGLLREVGKHQLAGHGWKGRATEFEVALLCRNLSGSEDV